MNEGLARRHRPPTTGSFSWARTSAGSAASSDDGRIAGRVRRPRVRDTPLAESGIVGTAIGWRMPGSGPVVEIQFDGFVYPAYDQIVTQLARHSVGRRAPPRPVVIRIPYGGGIGAVEHHSESPEGQFVLTPGLKVVTPATPQDGYWMIQQAIAVRRPGHLPGAEASLLADRGGRRHRRAPPPLWSSAVRRDGADATLITYGPAVTACLEAAEAAEADGLDLAVIDLRSLSPLDLEPVFARCENRARGGGARSCADAWGLGPRSRPHHSGVLLLVGGTGPTGDGIRHTLPAEPRRGRVPPRIRPHPGHRRGASQR